MADYNLQSSWSEVDAAAQAHKNGVALKKSMQTAKTDEMTQPVGVDSNGKLWTKPAPTPEPAAEAPVFVVSTTSFEYTSQTNFSFGTNKTYSEIADAANTMPVLLNILGKTFLLTGVYDDRVEFSCPPVEYEGETQYAFATLTSGGFGRGYIRSIGTTNQEPSVFVAKLTGIASSSGTHYTYTCDKTNAEIVAAGVRRDHVVLVERNGEQMIPRSASSTAVCFDGTLEVSGSMIYFTRYTVSSAGGNISSDMVVIQEGDPSGPAGSDYVLTAQDKQDIADLVAEDIINPLEVMIDESGVLQ